MPAQGSSPILNVRGVASGAPPESGAGMGSKGLKDTSFAIATANMRSGLDAALTIGRNKTAAKHFGEVGKRYSREMLDRGSAIRRYEIWCNELAASSSEVCSARVS